MKYVKKYEYYSKEYKIGDFVVFGDVGGFDSMISEFLNREDMIGLIVDISGDNDFPYVIKFFEKIPLTEKNIMDFDEDEIYREATYDEVKKYLQNKVSPEELDKYLMSYNVKKYNL